MTEQMHEVLNDLEGEPTHARSGPTTFWTTVNAAEALPGVVTPLTWSFYRVVSELSTRGAFCDLGVLRPAEVFLPESADDCFVAVFFGRAAINVDRFRAMVDRTPRNSGDSFEQQLFNTVRPGVVSKKTRRRYPVVVAKAPVALARSAARLRKLELEADAFWTEAVCSTSSIQPARAQEMFFRAQDLFIRIFRPHVVASMSATTSVESLAAACARAGHPGLESRLLSGDGSLRERRVLDDLWAVSRDRLDPVTFRARHGFHGPNEGELAARSWREDDRPLTALVASYRSMADNKSPGTGEARQLLDAADAEQTLRAATKGLDRVRALTALRMARHFVPLRELGRSAALRAIDVARAAARATGGGLVASSVLNDVDDVFFLSADELFGAPSNSVRAVVAERRARHLAFQELALPESWVGAPLPVHSNANDEATDEDFPLRGIPVSGGVIEGRARVLLSADAADELEPGEILVCGFTDPGWASLFLVAAALVIDVGGPLSHGAIVARELGIPAVINTRRGTRLIQTGDLVRVDAAEGVIELLESAES